MPNARSLDSELWLAARARVLRFQMTDLSQSDLPSIECKMIFPPNPTRRDCIEGALHFLFT